MTLEQLVDQGQFAEVYILAKKTHQNGRIWWRPLSSGNFYASYFLVASLRHPEDPWLQAYWRILS